MPNTRPLCKVTAYITRVRAGQKQMLVFRHPSAGIQLPAGTLDNGETPNEAGLREATEETGLIKPQIVRLLGVEETRLPYQSKMASLVW